MPYGKRCFGEHDEDHHQCMRCAAAIRRACKDATEDDEDNVDIYELSDDDAVFDTYDRAALKVRVSNDATITEAMVKIGKSSAWEAVSRFFGGLAGEARRRRDKQ